MNQKKTVVLYHANCTDGTGAKYAAWAKLGDENVTYIPVQYGDPVPEEIDENTEVFILDFSYPRDVLEGLQKRCLSVVVLDHHKTAEEALRGLCGCHFDMHKSGAVLAWEYFHPGVPVPQLLAHIQDRDLWTWKLEGSKEVLAGLALQDLDMHTLDQIVKDPTKFYAMKVQGEALVKHESILLKRKIKHVKVVPFCVNGRLVKIGVTNSTELGSELGNMICLDQDLDVEFAVVYSITKDNEGLLSLRSDKTRTNFDVSVVAKALGGGGHRNASGAKISFGALRRLLDGHLGVHYDYEENVWKEDE